MIDKELASPMNANLSSTEGMYGGMLENRC